MNTQHQPDSEPCLVWDTCEIAQQQAQLLIEMGEAADTDQAFALACEDSDLFSAAWEALTSYLTEIMSTLNPAGYWHAEVNGFGWRSLSGVKDFKADDGGQFMRCLLPNTECTFKLFVAEDNTIRLQNFHHDAPTGNEWYTVKAAEPWSND